MDASGETSLPAIDQQHRHPYDYFGVSVAISDGTIVVGACDDNKGSDSGSAVRLRDELCPNDASSFTQVALCSLPTTEQRMIISVIKIAISDGTIVVGATPMTTDDKDSAFLVPYASLFRADGALSSRREKSSWSQVAKAHRRRRSSRA